MSRRGKTVKASLAAAALTAASTVAPAAAHAEIHDAQLTSAFDRLSHDRVATFTLKAKSSDGIVDVEGAVRNPADAAPYATLSFTLVDGTNKDGTWQATLQTDVEHHPGANIAQATVRSADGSTLSPAAAFVDCFLTSVTDVGYAPKTIDIEHPDVTYQGRVMVQKYRDEPLEPAEGATVKAGNGSARTGTDGGFAFTATDPSMSVAVARQGALCGDSAPAPLTVVKQATETTARLVSVRPTAEGADVTVHGTVMRRGSAGLVPVSGLSLTVDYRQDTAGAAAAAPASGDWWPTTGADGTFDASFSVTRSGRLSIETPGTFYLTGGSVDLGRVDLSRTARISGPSFSPRGPLAYRGSLEVTGTLAGDWGPIAGAPVFLEFSTDRKTWTRATYNKTTATGGFDFFTADAHTEKDGYWRVRYAGDGLYKPLVTPPTYVDVRYGTSIGGFNASPEPVKKGKSLTVKGQLFRYMDKKLPGPGAPVSIYFQAKGSSKWAQVAVVKTASNGWFSKAFKASKDGTWMASYNGSASYLASDKPTDYVDVR
ncbi:hypothetical protein [Actinomadura verrucosospora]|uniref:Htaa domain protein n=1 Tax=Actinomadura verrucosospora TaxID=46165 RepID=A0A7D4APN0_ACTVE|nr:hypothetical protein [Actinomadura verrucosospora]QKG23568.1 hypothetical protein ACTIVE_5211 [Actinomadura verrucosospora]